MSGRDGPPALKSVGWPALPLFTYASDADGKACASTTLSEGARKLSFFRPHVKIFMWQFCAPDKAATGRAEGSKQFRTRERPLVDCALVTWRAPKQPTAFGFVFNCLLPSAFRLLLDPDVAVNCLDDKGRAAATELAGEVLADHLFFNFETERVVRLNLAGQGFGFDLCVGCAAQFDFDV